MEELTDTEKQEGLDNILKKDFSGREKAVHPAERYPYEGDGRACRKDESDIIDKIFRIIVANIAALFSSGLLFGFLQAAEVADLAFGHPLQLAAFVFLAGLWYKIFTKLGLFSGN